MDFTLANEVNLRGSRRCSNEVPLLSNKSIHYITHLIKVHPRIRFRVSRINNQHPNTRKSLITRRESLVDVCSCLHHTSHFPHHYTKTGSDPFITKQGKGKPSSPVQGRTSNSVMKPNKSLRRSKPFPRPSSFSSSIRSARHASARLHP